MVITVNFDFFGIDAITPVIPNPNLLGDESIYENYFDGIAFCRTSPARGFFYQRA